MICQAIGIAVGVLIILPIMHMLTDRDPPFRIYRMWIEPQRVIPGMSVNVVIDGVELRDCNGSLERRIVDSTGRIFSFAAEPDRSLGERHNSGFYRTVMLPSDLAPGPAVYFTTMRRWCNWAQRMFWPITSTYSGTVIVSPVSGF